MVRKIICLTGAILLAASVCIQADTHYVSWSGNMTPPYDSWETAAYYVEFAVDAAEPGDTVYIDTGTFYLNNQVLTPAKLTLRGKGMDSTQVIGGESIGYMFQLADSTTVEDIHFLGDGSSRAFWLGMALSNDQFFRRCKFTHFSFGCISSDGIGYVEVTNCWFEVYESAIDFWVHGYYLIENNTFYRPDDYGTAVDLFYNYGSLEFRNNVVIGGSKGVVGTYSRGKWEVTNNLFFDASRLGVAIDPNAEYQLIANNSLYVTLDSPIYPISAIETSGTHDSTFIFNNIFVGYSPEIRILGWLDEDYDIRIMYNCFYSLEPFEDFVSVADPDAVLDSICENVYANPMYVDPENGDLHLQYGSPCIDAGHPDILDMDGTRSDIGAFLLRCFPH